ATGCDRLPHDPGAPFPGTDQVITAWGAGADFASCDQGHWGQTSVVAFDTNLASRQITVTVPRTLSNPHTAWRATLAAGLAGPDATWLLPRTTADDSHPGGKDSSV